MDSLKTFCENQSVRRACDDLCFSYGSASEWLKRRIVRVLDIEGNCINCSISLYGNERLSDEPIKSIFSDYLNEISEVIIEADMDTEPYIFHIPYQSGTVETVEIRMRFNQI